MTHKDFELIAMVLAKAETVIAKTELRNELANESVSASDDPGYSKGYTDGGKAILSSLVSMFGDELSSRNPRFNAARFESASLPIHHAELKARILESLGQND